MTSRLKYMPFVFTVLAAMSCAQNGSQYRLTSNNSFPFVIPWDDAVAGTATDVSFLNEKPAGKNGFIVVKDGVFVEEKTGKRVRFFGTNLGARAAFPLKEDAPKIAAHLAKMGVNIVRFHHLQNDWDKDFGMIWKKGKEQIEFDRVQVDRLDFFIAELKKQGIYTNMNLQTTRKMIPELGVPASAMEVPSYQKKLDKMNEKMIALQKQYARDLIDRVNPYTKLKYKDDPAIMVVEINNENSLVGWPGEQPGAGLEKWPEPFLTELKTKWNKWLAGKYGSDAKLTQAWPSRDTRVAKSATNAATKWTWENQSNSDVVFAQGSVDREGSPELKATINGHNGPAWHIQAHLGGLNLVDGKVYTVQFDGKADRKIALNIDSRLDKPDWRFLGLGGSVSLGTEWKNYSLSFTASGTEPNHARIGFVLGDVRGTLWVKNLTVREGSLETGVESGQSLVQGNIGIPSAAASPKFRDYATFLVEVEAKYSKNMRDFLRNELGFKKANIVDSQIAWGGLTSMVREKEMEFADNHEYWNHPTFLGTDWDPKNYRVDRKALVNDPQLGTLKNLSLYRVAGKPYSISEYNHPAPSDFQSEMMPLYGAVGALQDWDILYTFAWDGTGSREKNDTVDSFFDFAKNPAKKGFFPATALLFRLGLMAPLNKSQVIPVDEKTWQTSMTPHGLVENPDILHVRYSLGKGTDTTTRPSAGSSSASISGEQGQKVVHIESDKALSVAGFIGGKTIKTEVGDFKIGGTATNFASFMLVPLDGKPLKSSARLLLTVLGRVENLNMGWNAARDSVSDRWGTGPTYAEVVPVSMTLKGMSANMVKALDGNGRPLRSVPAKAGTFELGLATKAAWYEITIK